MKEWTAKLHAASMRPWRSHGNEYTAPSSAAAISTASMRPWRSHGNEVPSLPTTTGFCWPLQCGRGGATEMSAGALGDLVDRRGFNAAVAEPRK